ncbi:hypothetical protein E3N88_38225 [Mikania micrantha]|uniref:Uncharacterized protein n=1 Tax=Mikania micrantha TaxID=192012 RepID=A0A5N6LTE3_9ASTR|nr:hypothetical protein E3N88_38225 [Mikania micrantha]
MNIKLQLKSKKRILDVKNHELWLSSTDLASHDNILKKISQVEARICYDESTSACVFCTCFEYLPFDIAMADVQPPLTHAIETFFDLE